MKSSMKVSNHGHINCTLCGRPLNHKEAVSVTLSRAVIAELIKKDHPEWSPEQLVCRSCLNFYRAEYVASAMESEKGELSALEKDVINSLKGDETLTANLNEQYEKAVRFPDRLSDKLSAFGGSWSFIIGFVVTIAVWMLVNSAYILVHPFDPYPYIFLNLVLSCIAAIQAPIIMMSQKRQEVRDRLRAENDYRVNLKAELEIRHLNLKLDQLITHQWSRLMEIQQIQTDIMEELASKTPRK